MGQISWLELQYYCNGRVWSCLPPPLPPPLPPFNKQRPWFINLAISRPFILCICSSYLVLFLLSPILRRAFLVPPLRPLQLVTATLPPSPHHLCLFRLPLSPHPEAEMTPPWPRRRWRCQWRGAAIYWPTANLRHLLRFWTTWAWDGSTLPRLRLSSSNCSLFEELRRERERERLLIINIPSWEFARVDLSSRLPVIRAAVGWSRLSSELCRYDPFDLIIMQLVNIQSK